MRNINIEIQRNAARHGGGFDIYLIETDYDGNVSIAAPVKMEKLDTTALSVEPTMFISDHFNTMQQMFDQLWTLGFRPSEKSKYELDAQSKHLEDMRKIAFMFLEKQEK